MTIVPEGKLVYGMQLQVQAKSKTFVEEWESNAGAKELGEIAKKADETGFFYVGVCDHLAVTKPLDDFMGATWYDTVATLGWIAGMTKNVRLLSHVYVLSYRHPLQTAKSFMTLDALSNGRAILGVGAGHLEGEFDLLGFDFTNRGPSLTSSTSLSPRRPQAFIAARVSLISWRSHMAKSAPNAASATAAAAPMP